MGADVRGPPSLVHESVSRIPRSSAPPIGGACHKPYTALAGSPKIGTGNRNRADLEIPVILGVSLCQNRRDKEPISVDLVAVPTSIRVEHDPDSAGCHDGEINGRGSPRGCHG